MGDKVYRVHAKVSGGKYLGEVTASSKEEAIKKAWDLESTSVSFCWHCSENCEDPEVEEIYAYTDDDDNQDTDTQRQKCS
jgi:hypothetical protein